MIKFNVTISDRPKKIGNFVDIIFNKTVNELFIIFKICFSRNPDTASYLNIKYFSLNVSILQRIQL